MSFIRTELLINSETGKTTVIVSAPERPDLEPIRVEFDSEAEARAHLEKGLKALRASPMYEREETTEAGQQWRDGTPAAQVTGKGIVHLDTED